RDLIVTGVQTCALPISLAEARRTGGPVSLERAGLLIHAVPRPAGGGTIVLGSPIEPILGKLASHVLIAMALVLAVLLLTGLALISAIYRHILRPIGALTAANRALVDGNEAHALV